MKNYLQLCSELEQAKEAAQLAPNQEIASKVELEIKNLETQIDEYDLGDDDLFRCAKCNAVEDIEDSIFVDGLYVCC